MRTSFFISAETHPLPSWHKSGLGLHAHPMVNHDVFGGPLTSAFLGCTRVVVSSATCTPGLLVQNPCYMPQLALCATILKPHLGYLIVRISFRQYFWPSGFKDQQAIRS